VNLDLGVLLPVIQGFTMMRVWFHYWTAMLKPLPQGNRLDRDSPGFGHENIDVRHWSKM